MTIEEIVRRLFDGFEDEKKKEDYEIAKKVLLEYKIKNNWTMEELDDWCWRDSNCAFDLIYGFI